MPPSDIFFFPALPGSSGVECHLLGYNLNDTELVKTVTQDCRG